MSYGVNFSGRLSPGQLLSSRLSKGIGSRYTCKSCLLTIDSYIADVVLPHAPTP